MGEGWVLIPYSCKQTSPTFLTDKPLNPPFTPVPLTRKGCFCLTGSEIHLPSSVPCNIPLHTASHAYPNLQPAPTGSPVITDIPALNLLPPVARSSSAPTTPNRSPRFPSEAGISPPHLSHRPTKSNRTGYKVFVNRSLGSQNMPARASKWLEKNLHLLEIRLRLLFPKR